MTAVVAAWLSGVVVLPFACFEGGGTPDGGDAQPDTGSEAACGAFCGVDAQTVDWTDTDASLALRARALLGGVTCSKGPEMGCHADSAGGTDLRVNDTSSFGIINIASTQDPSVLRVVPLHPESSYLYWKVTGDPRIPDGGLVMPASAPTISGTVDPRVVALVGPWIEAGAP